MSAARCAFDGLERESATTIARCAAHARSPPDWEYCSWLRRYAHFWSTLTTWELEHERRSYETFKVINTSQFYVEGGQGGARAKLVVFGGGKHDAVDHAARCNEMSPGTHVWYEFGEHAEHTPRFHGVASPCRSCGRESTTCIGCGFAELCKAPRTAGNSPALAFLLPASHANVQSTLTLGFEANEHLTALMRGALTTVPQLEAPRQTFEYLFPPLALAPALPWGRRRAPWASPALALNAQQDRVVGNIVEGRGRRTPYLVLGPPGTGKTHVLVRAVCALHAAVPTSEATHRTQRTLVVAPTNAACLVVLKKLLANGTVPSSSILRVTSQSRPWDAVPEAVKRVSMCKCARCDAVDGGGGAAMVAPLPAHACERGIERDPSRPRCTTHRRAAMPRVANRPSRDLEGKSIVVATLHQAASMASHKIAGPAGWFTSIFIDEASQAVEPLVLAAVVPLLLAAAKGGRAHESQLVLFGDPQQLGPVVKSQDAANAGSVRRERCVLSRLISTRVTVLRSPSPLFASAQLQPLLHGAAPRPPPLRRGRWAVLHDAQRRVPVPHRHYRSAQPPLLRKQARLPRARGARERAS